jgi:hypothetical protein
MQSHQVYEGTLFDVLTNTGNYQLLFCFMNLRPPPKYYGFLHFFNYYEVKLCSLFME